MRRELRGYRMQHLPPASDQPSVAAKTGWSTATATRSCHAEAQDGCLRTADSEHHPLCIAQASKSSPSGIRFVSESAAFRKFHRQLRPCSLKMLGLAATVITECQKAGMLIV